MLFKRSNKTKLDYFQLLFYYFKVFGLATMTASKVASTNNTTNHFWSFSRSKSTIVYNVSFILLFVMSNIYIMTFFCSGTYLVNFDAIADCGQTTIVLLVGLFILAKSCVSSDSLIVIANSISRITESLLSLSSTNIQKNNEVSWEIKKMFMINFTIWTVLFASIVMDFNTLSLYTIMVYFSNFFVHLLATQYSVILKFIKYDFKILNENLIEFGREDPTIIRSTTGTKSKLDRLLRLQKLHESLSATSQDVSNFYSYPMLVCILEVFIILILVCYYLAKPMIIQNNNLTAAMLIRCFWYGFVYVVLLVTLTKCVTATIDEVN